MNHRSLLASLVDDNVDARFGMTLTLYPQAAVTTLAMPCAARSYSSPASPHGWDMVGWLLTP